MISIWYLKYLIYFHLEMRVLFIFNFSPLNATLEARMTECEVLRPQVCGRRLEHVTSSHGIVATFPISCLCECPSLSLILLENNRRNEGQPPRHDLDAKSKGELCLSSLSVVGLRQHTTLAERMRKYK